MLKIVLRTEYQNTFIASHKKNNIKKTFIHGNYFRETD